MSLLLSYRVKWFSNDSSQLIVFLQGEKGVLLNVKIGIAVKQTWIFNMLLIIMLQDLLLFRKFDHDFLKFTAHHSVDKFLNEQYI